MLKNAIKTFSIFAVALTLQACAANIQSYSAVDANEKTITVPAGSKGLKGELKKALADDGWQLSVLRGPDVIEGTQGKNTRLEQYSTFNTRYSLLVNSHVYDYCLNFSPAVSYDISVIDNKSGSEVITMDGNGCENGIAQSFIEALNGNNTASN